MATAYRYPALASLRPAAAEAWPVYAADEIEAVLQLLSSGRVNQWTGSTVHEFEKACEASFGGRHGIAVANGSVALELALRAFGIGPGDEVVVSPRTFVASASCVMLVGATPVFADVDPDSGCITAETVAAVLTPRTKAIVPVHLGGWPADMPALMWLALSYGLKVIEDCAQSHGARFGGRPAGSFGDAAAFSFCQDKIISTGGEGGYVQFTDPAAWSWAASFKDHGKNYERALAANHTPGFRWLHDMVGTNWRLTGMQAAIGLRQLRKLAEWTRLRRRNAAIWTDALHGLPGVRVPEIGKEIGHAFYKFHFYLTCDDEAVRDRLLADAHAAGLRLFSGSCSEVYREHLFADLPRPDLPVARRLGRTSLMTEVHPTLDPDNLRLRAQALRALIRRLT